MNIRFVVAISSYPATDKAQMAPKRRSSLEASKSKRLKFANPPINELVIGTYFQPEVRDLRAEHIGLFWATVRDEFPIVRQQPPLVQPGNPAGFAIDIGAVDEFFPMPRYWFEAKDTVYLMQIQKDAFLFNWRKRNDAYPHFEPVKQAFDRNFERYAAFLLAEFKTPPTIQVAELTYTNLIRPNEYWSGPGQTSNVLPRFSLTIMDDTVVLQPPDFNQTTILRFAKDLSLRITVRNGRSPQGPLLVLELRATGVVGGVQKSETDSWFLRAHDLIGDCFLKITNPDVQKKYWRSVT